MHRITYWSLAMRKKVNAVNLVLRATVHAIIILIGLVLPLNANNESEFNAAAIEKELNALNNLFKERTEFLDDDSKKMLTLLDILSGAPGRILHDHRLDSKVESWVSEVDDIVVNAFYNNLLGEGFRIIKLKRHGPYNEAQVKDLIRRRANSLCGAFPLSVKGEDFLIKEAVRFVVLLSKYFAICDAIVLEAIEENMTRWTQEEAMPALLFLASRGIAKYENIASKFAAEENVKRLTIICSSLHWDTTKSTEH